MTSHKDRTSPLGFVVTRHVVKRIRTRMGIPKRAVMRTMEKAYKEGQRSGEFRGQFRAYLDEIKANGGAANEVIVFNNFLFLIYEEEGSKTQILTAWVIPSEHKQKG